MNYIECIFKAIKIPSLILDFSLDNEFKFITDFTGFHTELAAQVDLPISSPPGFIEFPIFWRFHNQSFMDSWI